MESLPSQVFEIIFSYVNVREKLNIRLVSRSLKDAVDNCLEQSTHLALDKIHLDHHHYVFAKFMHKQFVNFENYFKNSFSTQLFLFLSVKCPNIQIIYARNLTLQWNDLLHFGNSLKFFWCNDLQLPKEEDRTLQFIKQLKKLEAFELEKCNSTYFLLINKLLQLKKPLKQLKNPTEHILKETFKLAGDQGISSLVFDKVQNNNYSVPSNIGGNLSHYFSFYSNFQVDGPLFNLEYLFFAYTNCPPSKLEQLFVSSKLKVIRCIFRNQMVRHILLPRSFVDIFNRLSSFEKLEKVSFSHFQFQDSWSLLPLKCSLPPKIQQFEIVIHDPLAIELTTFSSSTLSYFKCNNFSTFEFNFPNLKVLELDYYKLRNYESSAKHLAVSLSKCIHLKVLKLNLSDDFDTYYHFQSLVDSLTKMTKLENAEFYKFKGEEDEEYYGPNFAILIDQLELPPVKQFTWRIPTRIMFIPFEYGELKIKKIDFFIYDYVSFQTETQANFFFAKPKSFIMPPSTSVEYTIKEI